MTDLLNVVMLICATVGSMALGVLVSYAICRVGFAWMHPRRRTLPVKARTEAVPSV